MSVQQIYKLNCFRSKQFGTLRQQLLYKFQHSNVVKQRQQINK